MTVKNRNKVVLVSALTAAALGVAGLAALAIPASAGNQPSLPDIAAEDLVSSVLTASPPAMNGTVRVDNALGLPAIPGLPTQARNGATDIRAWYDGNGRSRISLPSTSGEKLVVHDGTTVWRYDSATKTATRITHPDDGADRKGPLPDGQDLDPATAARQLLEVVRPTSRISVDGTALVAERPAYELVLAPAPTERSLLREVRIAVDSDTRIPLRLQVLANGTNDPVFSIAATQLTVGPQDSSLFTFTPPAGAKVIEPDTSGRAGKDDAAGPFGGVRPKTVGDGWDTVVVATLPGGLSSGGPAKPGAPGAGPQGFDPKALLDRFATPVSGSWGSGHLISTTVASVIITDDGRIAAGAVPQQVLVEALSQ